MVTDKAALDFFLAFTEGTDQIVFAYNTTAHQFTFLNPAFEKIWGKRRKGVMNDPAALWKTIHPEDQSHVQQNYRELLEGILIPDVEFRLQLRNQVEKWICVKPWLVEEHLIIGSAHNITAQKEYNEVLKRFSDKKNAILNILSHDLAGPLANIQTLSAILSADIKEGIDYEQICQVLSIIERSSKQGTQLIQDFIKQEFLASANVDLLKSRVELVSRVKDTMQEYWASPLLTQKTFHFVSTAETIFVQLDDSKFMQALNNLMSNAIKFTPDGGEITMLLEDKEDTVLIKIADTGIGIPQKYHATLFDKFTRARRPGIKGEPSVGLGMSIIKTIVEWHQGKIWFESQENQGTTFYIEVPKNQ